MTARFRQNKADRLMSPGASPEQIRCDFAVGPLDRVAEQMDMEWGIDRLPTLVSPATAEKYGRAMAFLTERINAADAPGTAAAAENCIKGLRAMDAEARALGHTPADPDVWQVEVDGKHFGFIRDVKDWPRAKAMMPGAVIFTLREAVVALRPAMFNLGVEAVKAAIPGAQVSAIRERTKTEIDLNDEIPF